MGRMDHDRFEELKEAYALDSLSEGERQEVERYLAENPSARAEVEDLSQVAALLALAPREEEPPARLRRNLMSRVRSEAEDSESGETSGSAEFSGRGREHRGGRARRLLGARRLAAAAAVVAIVGLGVWNVSLQSEVQDLRDFQMSAYELQGSGEAESAHGQVVEIGDRGAMMVAADLPSLPEGKTYEMWSIKGDKPESCGLIKPGSGLTVEGVDEPLSGAEQFAITVEPEGGSEQPTTEPVMSADLTSGA
ncbi:anti-sigma factor [Rubrobacter aplysinae]|uniref:anti-sigma factor n=1 Tax=Rubrobacter aplysinae TaxID=909625 RepID=UPI000AC81EFB|nr:anti-sigma factor [Rubrobacter aplysinae]